jgi:hypothetical protein
MKLDRIRALWRSLLSRSGLSERAASKQSGIPLHQIRDMVLPRRDTDVERCLCERVKRMAAVLPPDERQELMVLVAAARAGDLGDAIITLKARVEYLEAIMGDVDDHTPRTDRFSR